MTYREINHLIERYAYGEKHLGDRIVAALQQRIKRLTIIYSSKVKMEIEELEGAALAGLAKGLSTVNPKIGSPLEYVCKCAQWEVFDEIRKSKINADKTKPLSIDKTLAELHGEEIGAGKINIGIFKKLQSNDTYECFDLIPNLPINDNERKVLNEYIELGTYEKVAKRRGVTKQAISAQIRRITGKVRQHVLSNGL